SPGQTTRLLTVQVKGDNVPEADESFRVNLSGPVGATLYKTYGTGVIRNDDTTASQPRLTINDVTALEGAAGGETLFVFQVSLIDGNGNTFAPSAQTGTISVQYATQNLTAVSGSDYVATNGTLTFNPFETTKFITVTVKGDAQKEASESFRVALSNSVGAT